MLRFLVSEQDQPELPGVDVDGRVVIGSGAGANVRLPAAVASPEHVVIEHGRWHAHAAVTVDGVPRSTGASASLGDGATVAGGRELAPVALVTFELGAYRVRVVKAPAGVAASTPQRTESLARELMRSLLGDGAAPSLAIESGPKAGARRALQPPVSRLVIGRGDDADWSILDEDLSRRHAEIRRGWDGTTIVDLDSQNGTRVDGERITACELRDGARIELGNVVMVYADPAERHLAGAVTPPRPRAPTAPSPARHSALPFAIALTIAVLAGAGFVYVLLS
jgi:hypothetical protein